MNIPILSAEIAALVPAMSQDCRENNAQLIQGMIERELRRNETKQPTIKDKAAVIKRIVTGYYGTTGCKLTRHRKTEIERWSRMVCVHFARIYSGLSLRGLAREYGYSRKSSGVAHAIRKVADTCSVYPAKAREVAEIEKLIEARI